MVISDSSLFIDSTSLCDDVDSAPVPSTRASILSSLSRFRNRLGTEMDEIIPNLYLGSLRDAVDIVQLKRNRIQSIVSVHDLLAQHPSHEHLKVLRIQLSDCSSVDISAHFSTTNQFIHSARLKQTAVLVHCLAGVSRSATVVAAYLITACDLSFSSALKFIAKKRPVVNPNFGFRMQLCAFADRFSMIEKQRLREHFGAKVFDAQFAEDRAAICVENDLHTTISHLTHTSATDPPAVVNRTPAHIISCGVDDVLCGGTDGHNVTSIQQVQSGKGGNETDLPEPPIRKVIAKALPLPEIRKVQLSTLVHSPVTPEIRHVDK